MQNLQLNNSNPTIEDIPYPSNNPWITNKGMVFWYAPYEIACHAAGSPTFTLPVEVVKPCLSVIGKSFLE